MIQKLILPQFANDVLNPLHDGRSFLSTARGLHSARIRTSLVSPIFFPGGDIGTLAIYGTVNDLAMCGARARFTSLPDSSLEEETPIQDFWHSSIDAAGSAASVVFNTTTEFTIPVPTPSFDTSFDKLLRERLPFSLHSAAKRLKNHFFIASAASR